MDCFDIYLEKAKAKGILAKIEAQKESIKQAADWFAETIIQDRMVHLFGSGHSRIMVEEMWPRYGSFPGFNPIVELSLTFHNSVVGSNGQRQAMFLENVPGFADQILRNFDLSEKDSSLVVSSGGCSVVSIELAQRLQEEGIKVVALLSKEHSAQSNSKRTDGKKLSDYADLVLDTGAPAGDAMVQVDGLDTPVSPGSSLGGIAVINALKAELADKLTTAGFPPKVLTAACLVGHDRSSELFDSAYDEHARRLAKLYQNIGN